MKQSIISSALVIALVVFAGNTANARHWNHYYRPYPVVRVCAPRVYVPAVRVVAAPPVAYYGPAYYGSSYYGPSYRSYGHYYHAPCGRPHYYRHYR